MAALHPTTVYNVEMSVNQWFEDRATSITLPIALTYQRLYIWPEKPISDYAPCITLTHAPINRRHAFMGQMAGNGERGGLAAQLLDISVWVSRRNNGAANPAWTQHIRALRGLVEEIFFAPVGIAIRDYRTAPSAPSSTLYRATTGEMSGGELTPDTNPDIYRVRYTLRYDWTQRTNITT